MRIRLEQSAYSHNHAGLAVAALWDLVIDPGLLHRRKSVLSDCLNRRNIRSDHGADGRNAAALGLAVYVHGAGAALGDTAAELRSGEADFVTDHPQQRRVNLHVEIVHLTVDLQFDG